MLKITKMLRWSKTSLLLLSVFVLIIFLIGYIWWPLLEDYLSYYNPQVSFWKQIDLLLIGNFLVMSVLIMINADLRRDVPIAIVALVGGYLIEAWGTLSGLWTYYTFETPPLWIIPAWPIAALSVNRLYGIAKYFSKNIPETWFRVVYCPVFSVFFILLLDFSWPALSHPLTIFSLIFCFIIILFIKDYRSALLLLFVGSCLGYFLELWGTTRLCWTYYTGGQPPFFTVIAHGMASIGVWWMCQLILKLLNNFRHPFLKYFLVEEN